MFPLVVNLINLSVVAAWQLYSVVHPDETKKVTHLDFRRDIVINLLKHSEERYKVTGGKRVDLPDDSRYDGVDHDITAATQGRCAVCSKNTSFITRVDLVLQELLVLIIFEWSDIYISYTMIYTCVNKDFCMLLFFIPNT